MPYIGQPPVTGDTTKSFRLLDNIASYTLTFNATSASVVSTTNDTLTFNQHRFVTAQRVTYNNGGGTAIGGLTSGTAYFIIKIDQNTIKLATSAANANAGTAIDLTAGAVGTSHTLNVAFDNVNTKFKATYNDGTKASLARAGQLLISVNGVIQQPQESSSPTLGFGLEPDATIVFAVAPASTDSVFGQVLADTITNFDITDNTVDNFTGNGSTTAFTLSKNVPNNQNVLVTLDGVVQYPSDTITRAYSVLNNVLTFVSAPGNGVEIQVRHIGYAGATSSSVTGFYGRTGNVGLTTADNVTVGIVTVSGITVVSAGTTAAPSITPVNDNNTGIFFPSADTIAFGEGGVEAARFDSSGKLLVGTSTGTSVFFGVTPQLQVEGTNENTSSLSVFNNQNSATGAYIAIGKSRGTSAGSSTIVNSGDAIGGIYWVGADGTDRNTPAAQINCEVDGTPGANDMPGRLVFSTTADGASSPTEQMRVDSAGRVVIGEPANNDALVSIRPRAATPSYNLYCDAIAQYSGLYRFVRFRVTASNTIVGSIESNGSSTTYATTSDYRLKENVVKVTNAINRLQQLKPSRFNFIDYPNRTVDGFIAHEVQAIVPEAIIGTKDEKDTDGNPVYQGIDQSKLVPLLTAALQEAVAEIRALKDRVTALETP